MIHHEGRQGLEDRVSCEIVGAAIEVHRRLGPGLLESAYEACLCRELELRGISTQRQVPLRLIYRGLPVDCGYRLDILVEGAVVVDVKSVAQILPIHRAQLMTYLRLQKLRLGLLLNFNVPVLRQGIRRILNG